MKNAIVGFEAAQNAEKCEGCGGGTDHGNEVERRFDGARASGNADVYTVKATGTGLTRLTTSAASDADPAWSPDGARIAFVSERDHDLEPRVAAQIL